MNNATTDQERADAEALGLDVSDEALELAAGTGNTAVTGLTFYLTNPHDYCC